MNTPDLRLRNVLRIPVARAYIIRPLTEMHFSLPDIGDLLVIIALLFTALIVLFDTLERRREGLREQRMLDAIEQEYHAFRRLGRL